MNEQIHFMVFGTPIPKGSTRSFAIARGTGDKRRYTGQTVNMASNSDKLRPYEARVRDAARNSGAVAFMTSGPVSVTLSFFFTRPKNHYRSGKNEHMRKPSAPIFHTGKPDLDKLVRAVLDGMTGVVFVDDSQVSSITAGKAWNALRNEEPRAVVTVSRL